MTKIYTLDNDKMNEIMTLAMRATLNALSAENIITSEQASDFSDSHVCLKVDNASMWSRLLTKLKLSPLEDTFYAMVFKNQDTPQ